MKKTDQYQSIPPVWLVNMINAFRTSLLMLNKKIFPGNVVLYEQFQYFWLLTSLHVAAKLNIAETLRSGPKSIDEIASAVDAHVPSLYRIMRSLSSHGIFREKKNKVFALNAVSRALLDGHGSLRYTIIHHLGIVNWMAMGNLFHAVKTGEDSFTYAHGKPIYDYLSEHPAEYELFDKSMSNLSDMGLPLILNSCDFSKFETVADIGGGEGFLLSHILKKYPHLKGILFDLTEALQKAQTMLESHGISSRTEIVHGSFFEKMNITADVYILKNILHNWDDEHFLTILKNISDSMPTAAKIYIIDMVVPENNLPSISKLLDIQMLGIMAGGKERTRNEFSALIEKAGLRLDRLIPTIGPLSILILSRKA